MNFFQTVFFRLTAMFVCLVISTPRYSSLCGQQFVDIFPEKHNQQFLGGGVGFGNYWGHLINGQNATNQQMVYDWLFQDVDIEYVRFAFQSQLEPANDNTDPFFPDLTSFDLDNAGYIDATAEVFSAALARNANVKLQFYAQDYPDFLKQFDNQGNITSLDYDNPFLYEEIAEWVFANMAWLYLLHGIETHVVDLLNEPDIKPWLNQAQCADILDNVIPAIEFLVLTNPGLYGGEMPRFIGPSCVSLGRSGDWIEDWESTPTYDKLDIISGHLYGGAWPEGDEASNFRRLHIVRGGKQFTQNEAHPGQALNNASRLPRPELEDGHEGSLIFAAWMCLGLNNGVDVFHYFSGNNPSESNLAALVYTPFGGIPARKKQYYMYRTFTGLIDDDPFRCDFDMNAPNSYYATTLHPAGKNYVLLNIVNLDTTSRNFALRVLDNGGQPLEITRVEDFKTNGGSNIELVSDTAYQKPVQATNRWFAGETIRSLIIHYKPSDWTEVDYENFEEGVGIWNLGGNDARRNANDSNFAPEGNFCVRLRDDTDSSNITSEPLDLEGFQELEVFF